MKSQGSNITFELWRRRIPDALTRVYLTFATRMIRIVLAYCFEVFMYIYDKVYFYNNIIKYNEEEISEIILNKEAYYDTFLIPKKNGEREICAIKKGTAMHAAQVSLKRYFSLIPVSTVAKGFKKNESYFDFLLPHLNKKYYFRIDIKDFFGSISKQQICDTLNNYCKFDDIVDAIGELTTINSKLPQGAITSPILSNIIFSRIDQRILKYCQSLINIYQDREILLNDVVYTRYADDMLFSSNYLDFKESKFFLKIIKNILAENGFKLNYDKIKYGYEQIVLSGFVIGNNIHLSRKKMNELNTILHYFRRSDIHKKYRVDNQKIKNPDMLKDINALCILKKEGEVLSFNHVINLVNYLCGCRSFLISVERANIEKDKKTEQIKKRIYKIEVLVDALEKHYGV